MATYYVWSGATGAADGTSWTDAYVSFNACLAGRTLAGGDIVKFHYTHTPTPPAATISWTLPETGGGIVSLISVNKDSSDAPTPGAIEETGGNFGFNLGGVANGGVYAYGMTFIAGTNANQSSTSITLCNTSGFLYLDNCTLFCNSTNTTTPRVIFGHGASTFSGIEIYLRNCKFKFGHTGHGLTFNAGRHYLTNCSIDGGGSIPTVLIPSTASCRGTAMFSGCDFSGVTNVLGVAASSSGRFQFNNCALPAAKINGSHNGLNGMQLECHASAPADGTNGADLLDYYYIDGSGIVEDSQTVYITSGSAQGKQDDGTMTSYSLSMTPSSVCSKLAPLYTPWVNVFVGGTGSKTVSIKCADTEASLLKDSELWMEVEYVGGSQLADSPQSQVEMTAPVYSGTLSRDVFAAGSNLTDTGEAWTNITETGTYTLSKAITVDEQGFIRVRVGLGAVTAGPVYVNPKPTVA